MRLRYLIAFILVIVLWGCHPQGVVKKTFDESVSYPAMDAGLFERPSIIFHKGKAVYTWYSPKRKLMAAVDGVQNVVTEGSPEPSLHSFNVLHGDDKAIYYLFRPKGAMGEGWKYIIFRASYDGGKTLTAPVIINSDFAAMEPVIATNGSGSVYVAWYDERTAKFDIYMNISHDYGKTWLAKDIRIDTNNPEGQVQSGSQRILADGKKVWIIWVDSMKRNMNLMMRHSADGGMTWTEPQAIRGGDNFYDPKIFLLNGRLIVLWCGTESRFFSKIRGLYSDDHGLTWQEIGDIGITSSIQMEVTAETDKAGNLHLVLAVRDKLKTGIDNIYYLFSADRGLSWSKPLRLQTNKAHHTYANLASIAADASGRVMAVWVDFRNIRGNIYANYSKDYGRTWLKEEILLSPINRNANLPQVTAGDGGKFHVIWLEYSDDLMKDAFVKVKEVDIR